MSDAALDIQQERATYLDLTVQTLIRTVMDLECQIAWLKAELVRIRAEADKWRRLAAHREEDF